MTNRKKSILVFTLICIVIEIAIFLIPKNSHAAIIEPLYKVLQTQDQIKKVWNEVLTFINSLGAAVLIFIAFANILRININNYGIKKFLPTLILTIIAANFSYFICRALVDLANVVCDLLITGPGGSNTVPDISQSYGAFDFVGQNVTKFSEYPKYLIMAIMEFAGAVLLLILAFLFFIRNYVVYFLVVLAPLAFVSLSLPQTKSAFNQWWSMFWKWTFLPIVSLFWLWLAARWAGSSFLPGATTIMGFAFAVVCYYMAITTPFKMGGTILQQWGNLGKKAWGATGGKVADYYKAKNAATWGARMDYASTRFKEITGIGKGLEIAKEKQARAQRYRKAANDEIIGDWKKRNPVAEGLWEQRLQAKEGSSASATVRGLGAISEYEETEKRDKDGEIIYKKNDEGEFETDDRGNRIPEMERKYRYARAAAMAAGTQEFLANKAIWSSQWATMNNDAKKVFFQGETNPDGSPLTSEQKAERQQFFDEYARNLWNANVSEREAKKSENDPIKKAAMERTAIDNIVQDKQKFDELLQSVNRLVELERQGIRNDEHRDLKRKLTAAGYSVDDPGDLQDSQEYIASRQSRAVNNYNAKMQRYSRKNPIYLNDLISRDAAGNVVLHTFRGGGLERSRTGQYVNEEIKSGAAVLAEQYSMREIMNALMHGDDREGITQEHVDRYNQGRGGENPADINRKIQEFAAAARMTGGMSPQRPGAPIYVSEQLNRLKSASDQTGDVTELKRLVHEINYSHRALRRTTREVTPASESAEDLHSAITDYYGSNNEHRKIVMNALNANAGLGNEGRPGNSLR